jgi:hypothetical protein
MNLCSILTRLKEAQGAMQSKIERDKERCDDSIYTLGKLMDIIKDFWDIGYYEVPELRATYGACQESIIELEREQDEMS